MDMRTPLQKLGLSERESRVYMALLDLGPTTTGKLIRKTGIASSKIYDVLEKLLHKGLATYVLRNGKKEYYGASPRKLYDLIKEQEATIEIILPALERLYQDTATKLRAEIYTGKEGLKRIFQDILDVGGNWYVIGASGKAESVLPYFMKHFYTKMFDAEINLKVLYVDTEVTRHQRKELRKYKNIKSKFLPESIRNLMTIFVYGDKVAIIPVTPGVELSPLVILISSSESAASYRDYFKWLWKHCNN